MSIKLVRGDIINAKVDVGKKFTRRNWTIVGTIMHTKS